MATSNSNKKIRIPALVICAIVLGPSLAAVVHGRPSYATSHNNYCSDCHTNGVTGRMEVTGQDSLLDLGAQLDGQIRGPLKTFQAVPGGVVTLSVRVLDGNDRFAVQLKDFEKPAWRRIWQKAPCGRICDSPRSAVCPKGRPWFPWP